MLFVIHAYEDTYCGMHGIENYGVYDCFDLHDAEMLGRELSENVIDSYSYALHYCDDDDEEFYYQDHTCWQIWQIKDEYVNMGEKTLDEICNSMGINSFVEKYAEEVFE